MERCYELHHKALSIRYSKTLLVVYILAFSSYLLKNLVTSAELNYLIYTEIALLAVGVAILLLMGTKVYEKTYYKSMNLILAAMVLVKVLFDWSFSGFNLPLSAVIVLLCSSLSIHLKISFIHLFFVSSAFVLSFVLKSSPSGFPLNPIKFHAGCSSSSRRSTPSSCWSTPARTRASWTPSSTPSPSD